MSTRPPSGSRPPPPRVGRGTTSTPDTVRSGRAPGAARPVNLSEADQKQREQLVDCLREHKGNISAVARAMNKDRKQIQRWVKRFGLDPTDYR